MDDDSFAKLVNLQDHIFKCAETYPPPSAIDQVRKEHRRKLSGYILEICSIVAGVIHQETFDKVRQVESTSVGEAKVKSSSTIDKIQAELVTARKLLGDIESSIGDFTKLKTPQSDMRDQRVLECETSWSIAHNSYTTRSSLIMELESAEQERRSASNPKKVTYQNPDGSSSKKPRSLRINRRLSRFLTIESKA